MSVRRGSLLVVIAAAGLAACTAVLLRGSEGRVVVVELENAAGLREDYSVRIGGVSVGRVENLSVTADDRVRAVLRLDEEAGSVGRDARARVRSANLFGEKFVEIEPGDVDSPAPPGYVIPVARTSSPVELDEVLDVLDSDTRSRLAVLLNEAGTGLAGRGGDFNAMINELPGALDQTGRLLDEFARDNEAMATLVTRSDRVLRAVARERSGLGSLVEQAGGALAAFAGRRDELGASVREAAPTLVQLRRTLERIETLAGPLGPAADALRATAPRLAATLRELPAFSDAARPALRAAQSASPAAVELARAARPVLRDLEPTAVRLRRFSSSLSPVTELLERSGPDILGTMEGWARVTQPRDGLGHMFRNSVLLTRELVEAVVRDPDAGRASSRRTPARRRHRVHPAAPRAADRRQSSRVPGARRRQPDERRPPLPVDVEVPVGDDPVNRLLDFLLAP